jgi:hypothetical protein
MYAMIFLFLNMHDNYISHDDEKSYVTHIYYNTYLNHQDDKKNTSQ